MGDGIAFSLDWDTASDGAVFAGIVRFFTIFD
jgi:hypothetical protein